MKEKFIIIGSGAMGTAIAKVMIDANKVDVSIYGKSKKQLNDLKRGQNTQFFPKTIKLPKFKTYLDINDALNNAKYIAIAVPSKVYDVVLEKILQNITTKVIIINISKGFFPNSELSIHKGIDQMVKDNPLVLGVVSLIGPCFASQLVKETPSILSLVSEDKKLLLSIQNIFQNSYFRTYIQTDVIGSEVGAAYKNVIAIATGIADGLGYGINTTAALITRSLSEIKRFNKVMGGKKDTLMTLTGIGDLIITATSPLSRNFSFGQQLVKNRQKALSSNITIEGLSSLVIIKNITKHYNIDAPIAHWVYEIIYNNVDPKKVVNELFSRKLKCE